MGRQQNRLFNSVYILRKFVMFNFMICKMKVIPHGGGLLIVKYKQGNRICNTNCRWFWMNPRSLPGDLHALSNLSLPANLQGRNCYSLYLILGESSLKSWISSPIQGGGPQIQDIWPQRLRQSLDITVLIVTLNKCLIHGWRSSSVVKSLTSSFSTEEHKCDA